MTKTLPQDPLKADPAAVPQMFYCFLCGRRIEAIASATTKEFLLKLKRTGTAFLTCADCFGEVSAEMAKRKKSSGDLG
jgi:hypothetical protein